MGKILVVEDDSVNSMLLGFQLDDLGCDVERANDGTAGIESVLRSRPDVIVLDLAMPNMNGFEFLRTLRGMAGGRTIPVVVVTAMMLDRNEHDQLRALDVRRIFSKGSYGANELAATVSQFFGGMTQ